MKWIKLKGKLYNAGHITSLETFKGADHVNVTFSDGQRIEIAVAESERLLEFCGKEQIEITMREA